MNLKELYETVDGLAPFSVSEEYIKKGYRDNSGLLLDCGRPVEGILFSLDLSYRAIGEAEKSGANCIVTHHPAIWDPVMQLNGEREGKLTACIAKGISVISAHLNLDAAARGIDEWLMRGLGGKEPVAVCEQCGGGNYGRVFDVKETPLKVFSERTAQVFRTKRLITYGTEKVRRIASFCGGGFTYEALGFAVQNGADTLVSSDAKHHLIAEAVERGLNVLLLTHYAAENYGFMRFAEAVRAAVPVPVSTFTDERFL